jgi:hypothetical protein
VAGGCELGHGGAAQQRRESRDPRFHDTKDKSGLLDGHFLVVERHDQVLTSRQVVDRTSQTLAHLPIQAAKRETPLTLSTPPPIEHLSSSV